MRLVKYFMGFMLVCWVVVSCKPANEAKRYPIQGEVVSLDTQKNLMTLRHGDIPNFMPAMTMSYEMAYPKEVNGIAVGDTIRAELVVTGGVGRLEKIQLVAKAAPNAAKPAAPVHLPSVGDEVPDFRFVNQDGKAIHLRQFRGKPVLITFIYTRCPLPDFCPRMNENFSRVQALLKDQMDVLKNVELLSISFDPDYDTPTVLKHYARLYDKSVAGQPHADWQFAVPAKKDLLDVTNYFGLVAEPDGGAISHSSSTTIIGKDGKVVKWYGDNDWAPEDAAKTISQLSDQN
jgi:protein SCO1/2